MLSPNKDSVPENGMYPTDPDPGQPHFSTYVTTMSMFPKGGSSGGFKIENNRGLKQVVVRKIPLHTNIKIDISSPVPIHNSAMAHKSMMD